MCITGNRYVDLAIAVAAVAVTAGAATPGLLAAGVSQTAITIGTGMALGASTSAALGNDPLTGALIGGATAGAFGGIDPGIAQTSPALAGGSVGGKAFADVVFAGSIATQTLIGGVGALALDLVTPKAPTFATPAQATGAVAQIQQLNLQPLSVTGSGGPSATRSLAEAIRRTKDRKLTQGDVSDLSVDVSSFSPYGLQLAF